MLRLPYGISSIDFVGAGDGIRTRMTLGRSILSAGCMPFHHSRIKRRDLLQSRIKRTTLADTQRINFYALQWIENFLY